MSTTYNPDPNTGTSPDRRASSSLKPETAAISQRMRRTVVTTVLLSAAAAAAVPALLFLGPGTAQAEECPDGSTAPAGSTCDHVDRVPTLNPAGGLFLREEDLAELREADLAELREADLGELPPPGQLPPMNGNPSTRVQPNPQPWGVIVRIENLSGVDGWCTYTASPQNSILLPYVSPPFKLQAGSTYDLPIPGIPTGTDWVPTVNCDNGTPNTTDPSSIHY